MRAVAIQVIVSILILNILPAPAEAFIRACYFTNWARYKTTAAKYDVLDVDPNICTHLIYAFGKLDTNTKQLTASEPAVEEGVNGKFREFNYLKQKNPALKTLISIGGQNALSAGFLAISQPDAVLNSFATSAVQFLRDRNFDGLDIDWEYPDSKNKAVFTNILKALRTAFDADTKSPKLLLTFAGPAGQWNIDPGFDVPEIAKYVDYANLMTYDYTDAKATLTAFNSPLFSRNDSRFNPTLSTNWTIHYWNSLGMPFNKILVGVTGVGRRLVLENITNSAPGSNTTGAVRTGPSYQLDAALAYPEICQLMKNTASIRTFDQEQKNPYLVNGDDWVGYEDGESLGIKLQWMQGLGVAGLMFWSLDQDDFSGQFCGQGKYPLLNLVVSETTPAGQTTASPAQTTQAPAEAFIRACYFTNWARYKTTAAKYDVGDVDPNICTHLIYAFGKLDTNTKQLTASEPAVEEGVNGKFREFNYLKQKNPALRTLISIGGQNALSDGFLAISQPDAVLNSFATSAVQFLRDRNFDGLDIDWEYPDIKTKAVFTNILKALRTAFDADTKSPKLLLTFAGPAGQWNIDPGFDVPEIAKYVDYANLMTYDYTDAKAALTAFNSPLFSRNDSRFNPTLSTNWTIHYWNSLGMPFNKILVGVTGVGRRLVLENITNSAPGSNTTGAVRTGPSYQLDAALAYPEICQLMKNTASIRTFDQEQKNPYLVNGDDWVGYEDGESLGIKLQWMQGLGVAGLMFWSLDQDDFSGQFCGQGKYPLLNLVVSETTPAGQTTASPAQTTQGPNRPFVTMCYFPSWTKYRSNIAKYEVANVDPEICTHLIYAFGHLDLATKQLAAAEPANEDGPGNIFSQFNDLKKRNPDLKTLISIGGQNDHSPGFQAIAQSDDILQNFATTAVSFLRTRGFDGLDVDWEYPDAGTRFTFVRLLQALRKAFDDDTQEPKLLLTFAGAAGQWNIDPGYDVPEIARYVDFANLMTYDYTDKSAKVAAFNSPLYSRNDPRFNPTLSTNWTVRYWNSLGMPYHKIVVGVTGVGRRLVLQNTSYSAPGSNVTGQVRKGNYYAIEAGLAYPEICELLSNASTTRTFDQEQANPYLVNGDDWVGYEDKQSIGLKLTWMRSLGVAGFMFWSLDQDDFSGKLCGDGAYPLLSFVKQQTSNTSTENTTTATAQETTPPTTATTVKVTAEITEMTDYTIITRSHTASLQSLPVVIYIVLCVSVFLRYLFI